MARDCFGNSIVAGLGDSRYTHHNSFEEAMIREQRAALERHRLAEERIAKSMPAARKAGAPIRKANKLLLLVEGV